MAARLGRACPIGRAWRSARRRSSAHGSSSSKTSNATCCNSRSGKRRERSTLAQLQPPVSLQTLAEQAALAREAGEKAASELAELLARIVARPRSRARTNAGTQCAAGALAAGPRFAGLHRGAAAGRARQGIRQGDAVAEGAFARPAAARRAATARRARLGAQRSKPCLGSYLEAVCVEGLDAVTDLLGSFDGGHLAVVSVSTATPAVSDAACLQAKVQGAAYLSSVLSSVFTAETLAQALRCGAAWRRVNPSSRGTASGWGRTGCACRAIPSRTPG